MVLLGNCPLGIGLWNDGEGMAAEDVICHRLRFDTNANAIENLMQELEEEEGKEVARMEKKEPKENKK
jgi:hypothetical protein